MGFLWSVGYRSNLKDNSIHDEVLKGRKSLKGTLLAELIHWGRFTSADRESKNVTDSVY